MLHVTRVPDRRDGVPPSGTVAIPVPDIESQRLKRSTALVETEKWRPTQVERRDGGWRMAPATLSATSGRFALG